MAWDPGLGLEGRGVIVTGAAGGIGRPVAQALSAVGARILAVDLSQQAVDEVVGSLEGNGHHSVATDLREISEHASLIETAERAFGPVYGLVNVAAVLQRRSDIDDVTEDDWDFQLDVNLKAAFFLSRAAARSMVSRGDGGRIVLFSSQGWWTGGFGGSVVYSASKGGIVSMARGLARTYGPHAITVNAIAPGQVRTSMLLTDLDPSVMDSMRDQTPLGYVAEPEEMAGTVVFLLSDHARYITGATINVSGGYLMY